MTELAGRVIWITGASSGIGEALVHALAGRKNRIVISARREGDLERVKREAGGGDDEIVVLPLDLADGAALGSKADEVLKRMGRIDVLINNGGISQRSLILDTNMDVYRKLMEVNYFGTIGLTKAVLPGMIRRGGGHVVVVSSLAGKFGTPLRSGYCASKHALHGFFETLRAELWRERIKVTMICPGFIRTDVSVNALTGDGSKQRTMDEAQERGMLPADCAARIVRAVERDEEEVLIGGKEVVMAHVKRLWPGLYSQLIRRVKVN